MRNTLTIVSLLLALTACQEPEQEQRTQEDAGISSDASQDAVGLGTTEVDCTKTEFFAQTYNDHRTTNEVFYDVISVPGLTMTSGHTVHVTYCDYEAFRVQEVRCDNPARGCTSPRPDLTAFCKREVPRIRDGEVYIECGYRNVTTAADGVSDIPEGYRYNRVFLHIGSL